ncbi:putative ATP synthase subunit f, mitochondrial [Folsomia candida]|uniref:Putative ATP synthase subunit f, mitochondrial n=1 Tax=Folsomia candida TaxID=158441 RepID=A0A226EH04_FOLCA|nr:putative ATP synthase subunit f, mitochondrial [Folsomia candida]OXA56354.1 putative ATP synthase subunit f, mitochondrial [Folsomia candida]
MGWGEYPAEYNAKVHGPYDPARWYGKPDTAFSQVKIGELPAWLARRNKSPMALGQAIGRAWWRWNHKYTFPLKAGITGHAQLTVGLMAFFYFINYTKYRKHRFYKYH